MWELVTYFKMDESGGYTIFNSAHHADPPFIDDMALFDWLYYEDLGVKAGKFLEWIFCMRPGFRFVDRHCECK